MSCLTLNHQKKDCKACFTCGVDGCTDNHHKAFHHGRQAGPSKMGGGKKGGGNGGGGGERAPRGVRGSANLNKVMQTALADFFATMLRKPEPEQEAAPPGTRQLTQE